MEELGFEPRPLATSWCCCFASCGWEFSKSHSQPSHTHYHIKAIVGHMNYSQGPVWQHWI